MVACFTSSCFSNHPSDTPEKDTTQPKAWNLRESDYPNGYKYGLLLVDRFVNNENWRIEWLPNHFIRFQVGDIQDSIEFDILHKGAFEYGFFNILTKTDKQVESKIIHYLNDHIAILSVPDGLGRPYFFYLKKLERKIIIEPLEVDLNELPALIIKNFLVRTEESYAKNDSTEIRTIFVYKLNLDEGKSTPIVAEKTYEILAENGGEYFLSYENEDLFKFTIAYFCHNRDSLFPLCDQ